MDLENILSVIFTLMNFSVQTTLAGQSSQFYGYRPYYSPHQNIDHNRDNFFRRDCECVQFYDCQVFVDLQKASCGVFHGVLHVCCPRQEHEPEGKYNGKPSWTWPSDGSTITPSTRTKTIKHSKNNFNKFDYNKWNYIPFPKYDENFHYNFDQYPKNNYDDDFQVAGNSGLDTNLVDFEDPDTHKNCPPSFTGEEYDFPPKNSFVPIPKTSTTEPSTTTASFTERRPNLQTSPFLTRNSNNNISGPINNNKKLTNSPSCGISVSTRIVGGRDADDGKFPWLARIMYRNRTSGKLTYRCAGSVISNHVVITAAHCVTNLIDSLEVFLVRIGELSVMRVIDCKADPIRCTVPQDYQIEKIIPHPMYDIPKYANDIALIRLVRQADEVPPTPICLPIDEFAVVDTNTTGKTALIAGWGSRTAGRTIPSPILQYISLPIVNRTQCSIAYFQYSANSRNPIIVNENQICVQGKENMDACQGDSGGPLMSEGENASLRVTLLGLVSFGPKTCGVSNFPGVYTRVTRYIDWIRDNIGN